jgi:photosystem II stability/assembly factor-like uncharacterized protein
MNTLYAAMSDRLLVASGAGGDWTTTERLTDHGRLECALAAGDRVFVGTFEDGLQRSEDGGDSWERVGAAGIDHDAVMSLAVHPEDPDHLLAGTEPSALYRSTDGGDSWARVGDITEVPSSEEWFFPPRPDTHHVRWVEFAPDDPERIYVGIEAGALLYTTDGGDTWTERPPGARRDNHTLAVHPAAPERVYSAAGDGYAESTDRGESWAHPQSGLDHRYVWGVAVDPGDPDRVLVSAATGAGSAHRTPGDAHLYRLAGDREAGDDPAWERIDDAGVPTGEGALRCVLTAAGPGEFYACNDHGVYRSGDGGASFSALVEFGEAFAGQTCRGLAVVE